MNEADRFWIKVDAGDCWEWTAAKNIGGYGLFRKTRGKQVMAHRWAYEYLIGPIAEGLTVDHLCRVRHCVNPDHLELVDMRTNLLRGYSPPAQHARRTHCPEGHPMVQIQKQRTCRECRNHYERERGERIRRALGTPVRRSKRTHCPQGHPYNEANTFLTKEGHRRCRACLRASVRDWKRRKRAERATASP